MFIFFKISNRKSIFYISEFSTYSLDLDGCIYSYHIAVVRQRLVIFWYEKKLPDMSVWLRQTGYA